MIVTVLLVALALAGLGYAAVLLRVAAARAQLRPSFESIGLGAVTNFFDTLGIGSFAPTTAWLKLRGLVPDSFIPATLNAGHCIPTIVQALVFITLVQVDPKLLTACIVAAVAGSAAGTMLVLRVPVRAVQGVVGIALIVACAFYAMKNLGYMPDHAGATTLEPTLFAVAVIGHFVLGALMAFGVGLYAPSLLMLSLLGLDTKAVFPIMMGACAFLMPVTGLSFMRTERIDLKVVLGLAIGGAPAVLVAALVVKSLDVTTLRWGVVAVALYAAIVLLRAALRPGPAGAAVPVP